MMKNTINLLTVFGCLVTPCLASGPFKDVSYEEALNFAQKENKPILIDFYTTWCGPCKEMDQTVFKDEKAIRFLKEKTIAIKVDADKNKKLADKFKIKAFPTFVAVKPTGEEMDRLEGAITDTGLFLEEIEGLISGKDALTRASDKFNLYGGKNNPQATWEYIQKLLQLEQFEQATELLLWCFDKGHEQNQDYSELRAYVPIVLDQISQVWPKAADELKKRQGPANQTIASLEEKLANETDPAKRKELAQQAWIDVPAYLGFCYIEGDYDKANVLFDKYRKEKQKELAMAVMPFVLPQLIEDHEYAAIVEFTDIEKEVDRLFQHYDTVLKSLPEDKKTALIKQTSFIVAEQAGNYYQALLGTGKTNEASKIAARVLKMSKDPQVYNILAWNGYLSGRAVRDNLNQAKEAYKLEGNKNAAILDTLLRVMDQLGQKTAACELLNKELPKYKESEYDKLVIWQCGQDIGCEIKE